MATIENALYNFITSQNSIAAYVGTDVYPFAAPDLLETDFIRYQIITPSNDPVEFSDKVTAQPTIQIDVFSKSAANCLAIGNLLVTALHGFKGTLDTGLVVTTSFADGPMVMRDADEQWYHGIIYWEVEYTR
jgi:hypothetical protein